MYRRMGITLAYGTEDCSKLVLKAKEMGIGKIKVN